jgi:hypothetical protein
MAAVVAVVVYYCTDPKSTCNSMKFLHTDSELGHEMGHFTLTRRFSPDFHLAQGKSPVVRPEF